MNTADRKSLDKLKERYLALERQLAENEGSIRSHDSNLRLKAQRKFDTAYQKLAAQANLIVRLVGLNQANNIFSELFYEARPHLVNPKRATK